MAKMLRFSLPKRGSPLDLRCSGGEILIFKPIKEDVVINKAAKTSTPDFPEAWQPFVSRPSATTVKKK
jgi:hypothetical protein